MENSTFAQEIMSQLKADSEQSNTIAQSFNESSDEIALNEIDIAVSQLDDLDDDEYLKVSELFEFQGNENIEVSNFLNIDQLAEYEDEELVGLCYWTESRINQFIYGYMKFQFKKLFDAHSSVSTITEVLDWIFKYPVFKNEENVRPFSFQHIAISLNVCPLQLMQDLQTKITRAGIYDRIENNKSIVRSRRSIGLTFQPTSKQKQTVLKALIKRFEDGNLPKVQSREQLIRLVNRKFKERSERLLNTDDLFSRDNIRNTQRQNGKKW